MAEMEVKLGEVVFSNRRLRFLHFKSPQEIYFGGHLRENDMPLFLGADVLAQCSVSVANLPRNHAKFAKRGLATKMNFPASLRICEIHGTAKGVWFYSIQGLFRVAFEYYSREEQLEVLNIFHDMWKLRLSDDLLVDEINMFDFEQETVTNINTAELEHYNNGTDHEMLLDSKRTEGACSQGKPNQPEKGLEAHVSKPKELAASNKADASILNLKLILNEYLTNSLESENNTERQQLISKVSHWLGREFRQAKSDIEDKVAEFKKKHITTIDSLPPAEVVIQELFPPSMIVLLRAWMGRDDPPPVEWCLSPLLQLVLEFANQTLVSGVAHVLYSRLLRSDRV